MYTERGKLILDRLNQIFNKQRSHMEDYAKIESDNGLLQTSDIPVDLNDRFGQARLKDFAWRISEELGEALYSFDNKDEYTEEISDVLHFLAEFSILAGMDYSFVVGRDQHSKLDYLSVLYVKAAETIPTDSPKILRNLDNATRATGVFLKELAMACNTLKNKPWKQSTRETDTQKFYSQVQLAWVAFIQLCIIADIGSDGLYNAYFGKSAINEKRRETGY
jgi:hypothetical protein